MGGEWCVSVCGRVECISGLTRYCTCTDLHKCVSHVISVYELLYVPESKASKRIVEYLLDKKFSHPCRTRFIRFRSPRAAFSLGQKVIFYKIL